MTLTAAQRDILEELGDFTDDGSSSPSTRTRCCGRFAILASRSASRTPRNGLVSGSGRSSGSACSQALPRAVHYGFDPRYGEPFA